MAGGERIRCVRFHCNLLVSQCVRMQETQVERCYGCIQGAGHARAAGIVVKVHVRPRCRFAGCRNFAERNGWCMGHRMQLLRGTPLAPLRPYRKKVPV